MSYRIGIIGAPDSGKSAVIEALESIWPKDLGPLVSVPNPGIGLPALFDQAVGQHGSYREDLWCFFRLLTSEHHRSPSYLVSNGTVLGPLAHATASLKSLEVGMRTPEAQQEYLQRQQALTTLSMLFLENFRYNFLYYLPFPLKNERERSDEFYYNLEVDNAIELILGQFALWDRIPNIVADTPKLQANIILADISKHLARMEDDGA